MLDIVLSECAVGWLDVLCTIYTVSTLLVACFTTSGNRGDGCVRKYAQLYRSGCHGLIHWYFFEATLEYKLYDSTIQFVSHLRNVCCLFQTNGGTVAGSERHAVKNMGVSGIWRALVTGGHAFTDHVMSPRATHISSFVLPAFRTLLVLCRLHRLRSLCLPSPLSSKIIASLIRTLSDHLA